MEKKEYVSQTILLVLLILVSQEYLHAHINVKMMLKSVLMEKQ
jgi:hypothetical protein